MKRALYVPLLTMAAALSAGCSSSPEGLGTSAVGLRVEPSGEEDWSALTVELPTNVCQPGQSCSRPLAAPANVTIDGSAVAIGARRRLAPGAHTATVNAMSTSLTLTAGQATTLVLPVAHRKCQPKSLPTVPHTDFGQSVSVSNASCPSTVSPSVATTPGGATPSIADADLAFAPGDYVAHAGSKSVSFTLDEGDMKEVAIDLPVVGSVPATFDVDLSFADARELPDAMVATITSSCSGERSYAVPASTTSTQHLAAFQSSACTYALNAGGRSVTLDQAHANAVTLHRVDVDQPEVTREDGSTYTTQGTYELYFGGNRVAGPLTTNSGIDVLPGTYEIVIKFSTADGLQTQRQTVTL